MSTSTQKNYMDLMDEFFFETSKLKDDATNHQVAELLQENKALIDEIAALTKETKLFQKAQEQYDEFKVAMFEKREGEDRIMFAYGQLLGKIAYAPTSLHMRSAVVLLMPLLADALVIEGE